MQSDMQGIIEEQQITRRNRRTDRPGNPNRRKTSVVRNARGVPGSELGWFTGGSTALRDRSVEPGSAAVPDPGVKSFTVSPFGPATKRLKRPTRRKRDRLWLRGFSRPSDQLRSTVAPPGFFSFIPIAYSSVFIAAPLVLLALAVLLNTVVDPRSLVANRVGFRLAPSVDTVILADAGTATTSDSGEPLSIDATAYEKIRRAEYVVQPDDTISEIAVGFGLDPGTILSMNPIEDVRRLLPGTVLYIPDRDGVLHTVLPGESIAGIAAVYGVEMIALVDANDIESPVLQVGDVLFIPGASMDWQDYLQAIGELFSWPVRSGSFTSGFGMRVHPISGIWHMHTGIDVANRLGTPVVAAGPGRVVHIEEQTANYGKMIILDHGNGYRTLYAHLDTFAVVQNEYVVAGEQIGTMGNSGRSTGSHLHFSVFRGSQPIDPLSQLGSR